VALARSVEFKDLVVFDSRPGQWTTGTRGLALQAEPRRSQGVLDLPLGRLFSSGESRPELGMCD
jgi:hypothetical protein